MWAILDPASHFLWEWGTRLCLSTACRAHTCKRGFELALLQLLQHTCDIRRGAKNHNCRTMTSTTHAASSHFISAFEQLKKENASPLKWVRNLPKGRSQLFTASHVPYEYKQNSSVFHKDKDKLSFTCCTSSWCERRKIRITSLATVSKPSSLGFVFVFAALPPYPPHRMWCHLHLVQRNAEVTGVTGWKISDLTATEPAKFYLLVDFLFFLSYYDTILSVNGFHWIKKKLLLWNVYGVNHRCGCNS